MIINHNMLAINTHRQMGNIGTNQAKSTEKLSSGMRINRAGDDAAGLAISEKMRSQVRGLNQASRNAQDGISMVQTAEGALNETQAILQRMRELAVQASSDTNTADDRVAVQDEINQLTSEINRIGNTTEFNGMKVLNGDKSSTAAKSVRTVLKAGDTTVNYAKGVTWVNDKFEVTSDGTTAGIKFTGADGSLNWNDLKNGVVNTISIEKDATNGTFKVDITAEENTDGSKLVVDSEQMVLNGDKYVYDNHGVTFEISKSEFDKVADGSKVTVDLVSGATAAVDATASNFGVLNDWASVGDATDATKQVSLNGSKITVASSDKRLADVAKISISGDATSVAAAGHNTTVTFKDINDNIIATETIKHGATLQGSNYSYDNYGVSFQLDFGAAMTTEGYSLDLTIDDTEVLKQGVTDSSAGFQVGANANQSIALSFDDMRASSLGIVGTGTGFSSTANVTDGTSSNAVENALDVTTSAGANNAISILDSAIASVSQERAKYGSVQNRLEHSISNLNTSSENLQAAESRIRDVDMAKEMMEFTKNNILQQAAQSMLAQANQAPQGVLQLLR